MTHPYEKKMALIRDQFTPDGCRLCRHPLTEPEDGPLYCAPCKLEHPELARRGIDSERREDCQYIINPHIPRDTE